jgi:hypothetical protein
MTAGYDGTLQFWRLSPRKPPEFLDDLRIQGAGNHDGADGFDLQLLPDGNRFSIWDGNGHAQIWSRQPLARLKTLSGLAGLWFHPNLPWLLAESRDRAARIDLDSGATVPLPFRPQAAVPGSTLLVGLEGLEDGRTGKLVRRWGTKVPNVDPVSVSPDGRYAVIGGEDPTWTPPNYAATEAAYARNQTLRVWRLSDGKLIRTLPGFYTMRGDTHDLVWLSRTRLYAPGLGWVRDVGSGRLIERKPHVEPSLYELPFGEVPVTLRQGGFERRALLRFPDAGVRIRRFGVGPDGALALIRTRKAVYRGKWSEAGAGLVASELRAGKLSDFDENDARIQAEIGPSNGANPSFDFSELDWKHGDFRVKQPSISFGGGRVAFAWDDYAGAPGHRHETCVVDLSTRKPVARLATSFVSDTALSADGSRLALMGFGTLAIVDLNDPAGTIHRLQGGTNPVGGDMADGSLRWTRDGRRLIVVNSLRPLQVYDSRTHALLATMRVFADDTWLAVRSDGAVDGSPGRVGQARVFGNGKWVIPKRSRPFFLDLIRG